MSAEVGQRLLLQVMSEIVKNAPNGMIAPNVKTHLVQHPLSIITKHIPTMLNGCVLDMTEADRCAVQGLQYLSCIARLHSNICNQETPHDREEA